MTKIFNEETKIINTGTSPIPVSSSASLAVVIYEDGMPFPKTHNHNTELTLGGITYARAVEILDPYTITFENGEYGVSLVGANSNIVDRVNVNSVSVRPNNSAGLIVKTIISGSGLSVEQNTQLMKTLTLAKFLGLK